MTHNGMYNFKIYCTNFIALMGVKCDIEHLHFGFNQGSCKIITSVSSLKHGTKHEETNTNTCPYST